MANKNSVLLVDDDGSVLSILSRYLEKYNFTPILSKSAPIALRKFDEEHEKIGLIVTDMQMPLMSGEEFIRKINAIDPEVPIIIFSGTGLDFTHLSEISNVKEILQKPINYNQFHVTAKKHFAY